MRFLLCLALLCLAESSHHFWNRHLWSGSRNKEYVFKYKGMIYSGLPAMSKQYSALVVKAELRLFPTDGEMVYVKLTNVMVGKTSKVELNNINIEDIPISMAQSQLYKDLSIPFAFKHVSGKVVENIMSSSDPVWSRNMKRGIIEKFQVNLFPNSVHYPEDVASSKRIVPTEFVVLEDGIGGMCQSTYDVYTENNIFRYPEFPDVLNVTKTRNYEDCRHRPVFETDNFDSKGCPWSCRSHPHMGPEMQQPSSDFGVVTEACPCGFEKPVSPIKSYSVTKYNISLSEEVPVIEGLVNEGKISLHLEENDLYVLTRCNITFLKIVSTGNKPNIPSPVRYSTLGYEITIPPIVGGSSSDLDPLYVSAFFGMMGENYDLGSLVDNCYELHKEIAIQLSSDDEETSGMHKSVGTLITKLIRTMSLLDKNKLKELQLKVMKPSTSSEKAFMRKIFLDCLPLTGTTHAVKFIKQLFTSNILTTLEAKEIIEAVPKALMFPTVETVNILRDLCLHTPKVLSSKLLLGSTCLAFGKLVHEACVKPHSYDPHREEMPIQDIMREKYDIYKSYTTGQDHLNLGDRMRPYQRTTCKPEDAHKFVEEVKQKLEISEKFREKAVYIEVLAHIAHIRGLEALEPYVKGVATNCLKSESAILDYASCNFLRQITIYALHHMVKHHPKYILRMVTPIYFNRQEPYELRVAAFTVILFSDPPLHILERVVSESWSEPDKHVGSFVYSTLKDFGNGTHLCVKPLSDRIKLVFHKMKQFRLGVGYSKFMFKDIYSETLMEGLQWFLSYTSNNVSVFPRSFYHSLTHNWDTFFNFPLEMGGNLKGVDDLLRTLGNSYSDILSSLDFPEGSKDLSEIFGERFANIPIRVRSREKFQAAFFMKYFDRTSYVALDKETILEWIEELISLYRRISTNRMYTYLKIMLPSSVQKIMPSELGLPVIVSSLNPVAVSVIFKKITSETSSAVKEIKILVKPKIHYESIITGMAITPPDKTCYGTAVLRDYHSSVPVEMCIRYGNLRDRESLNKFEISVRPFMKQPLLHHVTVPGTFATRFEPIPSVHVIDLKQLVPIHVLPQCIPFHKRMSSQLIGMGVEISGKTEDYWSQLPLWKKGRTLKKLAIECWKMVKNPSWVKREVQVTLTEDSVSPNNKLKLQLSFDRTISSPNYAKESSRQLGMEIIPSEYNSLWEPHEMPSGLPNVQSRFSSVFQKMEHGFGDQFNIPISTPSQRAMVFMHFEAVLSGDNSRNLPLVLHALYTHSLDRTFSGSSVLMYHRAGTPTWIPSKLCVQTQIISSTPPSDLHYKDRSAAPTSTIQSQVLKDCESSSPLIQVKGVFEKVHIASLTSEYEDDYPVEPTSEPWYVTQCRTDTDMGKSLSFPCRLAIYREGLYNKLELVAHYVPDLMTPWVKNVTEKLTNLVSYVLYPNVDHNRVMVQNPPNQVRLVALFKNPSLEMKVFDLLFFAPHQNFFLKKLSTPYLYPLSTWTPTRNLFLNELIDYDMSTECLMMENYLTTLDNVTIPYPHDSCPRMISKDCSDNALYAVYAKGLDGSNKKELTVVAGGVPIVLPPPSSSETPYRFSISSSSHEISYGDVYIIKKGIFIYDYLYVVKTSTRLPIVVLTLERFGISIKFDGTNAKIRVSPLYRGKHCGICGDYNGNGYLDFLGPKDCIYEFSEDFVRKYTSEECRGHSQPRGHFYCPITIPSPFSRDPFGSIEIEKLHTGKQWDKHTFTTGALYGKKQWNEKETKADSPWKTKPADASWSKPAANHPFFPSQGRPESPLPSFTAQEDPGLWSNEQTWSEKPMTAWGSTDPNSCQRLRTKVIERDDDVCFSLNPIAECKPNCRAAAISSINMPYHCVSRSNSYLRELIRQSNIGVLNVKGKSVDIRETTRIPTGCRPVLSEM